MLGFKTDSRLAREGLVDALNSRLCTRVLHFKCAFLGGLQMIGLADLISVVRTTLNLVFGVP